MPIRPTGNSRSDFHIDDVYQCLSHSLDAHLVNYNCNWGTCIAHPTRRPRAHHRVNPYLGARRQNETNMFFDHDETSSSIAAVSASSVACSMLAVQQQKRLCRQFVEVSAARRVATRWSTQCRSTWNIGNRCQKVCDIFRRMSQTRLVNQQAQLVLDPLSDWQPVQLSKSWSHAAWDPERCVPLRAGLAGTVPVWKASTALQ